MITWMEGAYVTAYDFIVEYLNPVVWYEYIYKAINESAIGFQNLFLDQEARERLAAERLLREKQE